MAAKSPFLVDVRDLPCTRELSLDGAFVGAAVAGMPMREALEAPVDQAGEGQASLSLYSEGTHVFASGHIRGTVRVACSRCVELVELPIDEKVMVTFMPAADMPDEDDAGAPAAAADGADDAAAADDGAEIGAGDLDLFPYDGEVVDLTPLLREQFILAVPYAPLCREDCQGLCPQCGTNRNLGACACEKPLDPRFAGLAALKLPS
jgi:uncharacterized protein